MSIYIEKIGEIGRYLNEVYVDTLDKMMQKDERVLCVEADLAGASGTLPLKPKYGDRFIDVGIAESNLYGIAAGLSKAGKIPYAHTFAAFATRRAADQIFISGCYAGANVKVIASAPGIMAQLNGGTHMCFEDLAIVRGFAGMTVMEPSDGWQLAFVLEKVREIYGMHYIRLARKNNYRFYQEGSQFEIGKAVMLRDGSDVTIIACGAILVNEARIAAEVLAKQGISARVLDMFTIKPIDREAVEKAARETGAIVTAENHNVFGGLGSAVAEAIVETIPVPMERVGIQDAFGQVGTMEELQEVYGLTADNIVRKCLNVIKRKH